MSKGQISLNFNYKVNSKDFYTKLVFSQIKDTKHLAHDFSFCSLGLAPGVRLGNVLGQKFSFSEHGHVAYQIEGDGE